ncbi:MAG TPA: transglutaminase-like domain-containing protein, partial [Methanotrichaceae archaeon]|nr:transglutaminase-like domain-containing protein [Methanotrichaceae archaeon]
LESGTFDIRAWKIWKHVSENVEYHADKSGFWLLPEETLHLGKGGCEDRSFLLASMLLASGISDHCLRVVLGRVYSEGHIHGHAWTVYQNEGGQWCLLDSTLEPVPQRLIPADPLAGPKEARQYQPMFCFNRNHLWRIWPCSDQMADYLKIRETESQKRCQTLPFMEMEAF